MAQVTNVEAALVLEKAAEFIESLVSEREKEAQAARTKRASALAESITQATGEELEAEVVEKIADLPEVAGIFDKLAGSGLVDSMGGPEEDRVVKTASGSLSPEDQRFLDWVNG